MKFAANPILVVGILFLSGCVHLKQDTILDIVVKDGGLAGKQYKKIVIFWPVSRGPYDGLNSIGLHHTELNDLLYEACVSALSARYIIASKEEENKLYKTEPQLVVAPGTLDFRRFESSLLAGKLKNAIDVDTMVVTQIDKWWHGPLNGDNMLSATVFVFDFENGQEIFRSHAIYYHAFEGIYKEPIVKRLYHDSFEKVYN